MKGYFRKTAHPPLGENEFLIKKPTKDVDLKKTNNLIALLNLYEIIFVCIKSSLYEPCTDGGLKYNLSHLFHPQKNKFPFSCQ